MEIKDLTTENFDESLKSAEKAIVDFWAPWCGPCKSMAPVIEDIAAERDDVTVFKVNVDEQPELASRFMVRSIPFFGLFEKGELVNQTLGAQPKSSMIKFIESK